MFELTCAIQVPECTVLSLSVVLWIQDLIALTSAAPALHCQHHDVLCCLSCCLFRECSLSTCWCAVCVVLRAHASVTLPNHKHASATEMVAPNPVPAQCKCYKKCCRHIR